MRKVVCKKNQEEKKTHLSISDENFKIYLRVKPDPQIKPQNNILKILNATQVEITSPYYSTNDEKVYHYQEVFPEGVKNSDVFNTTMISPIQNALNGLNSTIFIYGMTGAGKTYTMFGNFGEKSSRNYEEQGLVSKAIDFIFDQIQKEKQMKTQIQISFYEIYNENIRDLLADEAVQLSIMEDPVRGVFVNGLVQVMAQERAQTKQAIMSGIEKRSMNATKSNEVSSRSHAILQFNIRRYCLENDGLAQVLESKFFMIDLAGNQKTSNNESKRFIEGVNINKSLLTLGKCLSVLADNKNGFVPFRDSKLTRILKQSLGGNSKTVMIACASSSKKFYEETLNTLKYSSIAKKIKNKGIKHNIKLVSKEEICSQSYIGKGSSSELQVKVKGILTEFLQSIEEKTKIERMLEDLEKDREQNFDSLRLNCQAEQNIVNIDNMIKKLNRVYEKKLEKSEVAYNALIQVINSASRHKSVQIKNHENQIKEIYRLNEIILQQNKSIKHLQSMKDSELIQSPTPPHFQSQTKCDDNQSIFTDLSVKENQYKPTHTLQTNRSKSGKAKKLTINCLFEENTTTALQNLSNLTDSSRRSQKINPHREIVINLHTDKADNVQKTHQTPNRDSFVKRLRETEKNAKATEGNEIQSLLEQHQSQQYELGNVQMSMLRKLKFFQREKIIPRSNSLNRFPLRNNSSIKNSNLKNY